MPNPPRRHPRSPLRGAARAARQAQQADRANAAEQFDRVLKKAITDLPAPFGDALENIIIDIRAVPPRHITADPYEFLGYYEGVPLPERTLGNSGTMPDRIYLFTEAIRLEQRESREPLTRIIRDTLYHEIGHYFGMSEEDLDAAGVG